MMNGLRVGAFLLGNQRKQTHILTGRKAVIRGANVGKATLAVHVLANMNPNSGFCAYQ